MSRAPGGKQREQLPTMLIMGEGFAEVALLRHLRLLFLPRGAGLALTIDNAHGKGAKNVVSKAIAKSRVFAYDHVWVLLDTDTDYDERLVSEARKKKIQIAACHPCLEAALLQIKGVEASGQSAEIKRQFEKRLGMPAHQAEVYTAHFGLNVLESALGKASPVGTLIQAMQTACMRK
jgi:hypothetical protein